MRIVVVSLTVLALLVGAVVFYAWKNLSDKVNDPHFKTEIETTIAKRINGTAAIGRLKVQVSLRPWVLVEDVALSWQEGKIELKADSLHFDVELLPLLQKNVIFSQIDAVNPKVKIRRPKEGTWPVLRQAVPQKKAVRGLMRVEMINIQGAHVAILDENNTRLPHVDLDADGRIAEALDKENRELHFSGKIAGPTPVSFTLSGDSAGVLSAQLIWASTSTSATATLSAKPHEKHGHQFALHFSGEHVDLGQVAPLAYLFIAPRVAQPTANIEWSLEADWDVKTLRWAESLIPQVKGTLTAHRKTGHVNIQVDSQISSGTVTAHVSTTFRTFSATTSFRGVEVEPIVFAISTNPFLGSGRFSGDLVLQGALRPWRDESLSGWGTVDIHAGHLRSGPVVLEVYDRLNLRSLIQTVTRRRQQGIPFEVIAATGVIQNGRITFVHPAVLKSPTIELAYTGWAGSDLKSGKGTLIVNPLVGSRDLIKAVPVVSQLVIGPSGEFLPLVVDVSYKNGKVNTTFRSIKTLARPVLRIMENVLRFPFTFWRKKS